MKSNKVLRWVALVSVSVLGACGGLSGIGSSDDPNMGKSGSTSTGGTKGEGATGNVGKGAEAMGASANLGGKDPGPAGVAGVGSKPGWDMCATDKDCPSVTLPCEPCADGSFACNKTYCGPDNMCVHTRDTCATKCSTDQDCPVLDVACLDCGDGSVSCPSSQCLMGFCQTSIPGCGNTDPCEGLKCGESCDACPRDKMCDAAAGAYCSAEGKCQTGIPQCGDPGTCKTSMDCGAPPPECVACGNDTCAQFECIENKCVFACPPNPQPECETQKDCPIIGDICYECEVGDQCAVQACIKGSCEMVCPVP